MVNIKMYKTALYLLATGVTFVAVAATAGLKESKQVKKTGRKK